MLEAFHNCEIETDLFMHEDYNVRKSATYDAAFDAAVEGTDVYKRQAPSSITNK